MTTVDFQFEIATSTGRRLLRGSQIRIHDGFVEFRDSANVARMSVRLESLQTITVHPASAESTFNTAVRKTAQEIIQGNRDSYLLTFDYMRRTFKTTYWMNVALFGFGVLTFLAAFLKGLAANSPGETAPAALFGGLSVASFITVFLTQPLRALPEASRRLSWLLAILNTYWTRLAYFSNPATFDQDIVKAESDLVSRMLQIDRTFDPGSNAKVNAAAGAGAIHDDST